MSNKIKIKFLNNIKQDERFVTKKILEVCPNTNLRDAHAARTHVVLTLSTENEILELLKEDSVAKLEKVGLKPMPPPYLAPARTVYVHKLRPYITDRRYLEILEEINSHSINPRVESVYIIPNKNQNTKTLKLICRTPDGADQLCNNGLFLYDINVDISNLRKEEYLEVNQCYKCFSFQHPTHQCTSTVDYCSICSKEHHYTQCTNKQNPSCKLCDGDHYAVSYTCPVRKLHIKNLVDQKQNKTKAQEDTALPLQKPVPQNNNENFPTLPNRYNQIQNSITTAETLVQAVVYVTDSQNIQRPNSNEAVTYQTAVKQKTPIESRNSQITVNSLQNTPTSNQPKSPVTSKSAIKEHEWEIKLGTWGNLADKLSGNNHYKYACIMNEFLVENDMTPIDINRIFEISDQIDAEASQENNENSKPKRKNKRKATFEKNQQHPTFSFNEFQFNLNSFQRSPTQSEPSLTSAPVRTPDSSMTDADVHRPASNDEYESNPNESDQEESHSESLDLHLSETQNLEKLE